MLVFTSKTFTSQGKEVHLSKYKALQPRKPSSKQLKPTHWVLAAKPYRGWCFSLGELWQKVAWPLAVLRGSCSAVVWCRFPQEPLCYNLLLAHWTHCRSSCKVLPCAPSPCLHYLPYLPETCQRAKPCAFKPSCISQKTPVPPDLASHHLSHCQALRPEIIQVWLLSPVLWAEVIAVFMGSHWEPVAGSEAGFNLFRVRVNPKWYYIWGVWLCSMQQRG